MASFPKTGSLRDFQTFIKEVYSTHDDRFYSIWDLMSNLERFAMRALKGIRKEDKAKLTQNLLISLSWVMGIASRLHLDIEDKVWERFPMLCTYCGGKPCACKKVKADTKPEVAIDESLRPETLAGFQAMLGEIYPPSGRTLADAGVHFAEEVGEVSEAIHAYMGEHKEEQLGLIQDEIADLISNAFGVANSAEIDLADELSKMYYKNCHACHEEQCVCTFSSTVLFKS